MVFLQAVRIRLAVSLAASTQGQHGARRCSTLLARPVLPLHSRESTIRRPGGGAFGPASTTSNNGAQIGVSAVTNGYQTARAQQRLAVGASYNFGGGWDVSATYSTSSTFPAPVRRLSTLKSSIPAAVYCTGSHQSRGISRPVIATPGRRRLTVSPVVPSTSNSI